MLKIHKKLLSSLCVLFITLSNVSIGSITVNAAVVSDAVTSTVYWNNTQQRIDGFGISEAFRQSDMIMNLPTEKSTQILDLLFSQTKGAGISIVRNIVGDGGTWGIPEDGPTPTIEPSEGVWNWTGDESQIWIMNQAKLRGVTRFFSTVWSPPAWMKTNNDVTNGGYLRTDKYQAYAEYLAKYVTEYKSRFDIDIYAVSIANEPDFAAPYSGALWTGEQFRDFIKNNLAPTFAAQGVPAKVIMPETTGQRQELIDEYVAPTLNDPEAAAGVDIVGVHGYDYSIGPIPIATGKGKDVWLTEISTLGQNTNDPSITNGLKWAKSVHDYLTIANVNAYNYFWGAAKHYTDDCNLIGINLSDNSLIINKRLFTIGNFSRFVRPGYVRIAANEKPDPDVYISAYKDPATNKFVVVAINDSASSKSVNVSLNGFTADSVTPYRTSATEDLSRLPDVSVTDGTLAVSLNAQSVTTFVGTAVPSTLATSKVEAENFSATSSGLEVVPFEGGGQAVGYIQDGAYAEYDHVDFGSGVSDFSVSAASPNGGNIELRLDSPTGTLIGTIPVTSTGSWDSYSTFNGSVYGVTGVHKLYLKFTGGSDYLMNVNWWKFNPVFTQTEAETYNEQSGIQKESSPEGGQNIGYIENGDWVKYSSVDFDLGVASFDVRAASGTDGGNIELRLDSLTGPVIGTCAIAGTGDWQTWTTKTCTVSGATGIHDLYLKFTGGSGYLMNVNWWKFNPGEGNEQEPLKYMIRESNPVFEGPARVAWGDVIG